MSGLHRASLLLAATASLVLGCYSVEFDESRSDVYYCQSDDDCLAEQSCSEFRCVDDRGPALQITLPEPLTPLGVDDTSLAITFAHAGLVLSDADAVVEGEGKVHITIDPDRDTAITEVALTDGLNLEFGGPLEPGPHRLIAQAVYGDGTSYANPSAIDHTVFFVQDVNPARPQVAIVEPRPGYRHVVGEPLTVTVATRNFDLVNSDETGCQAIDCDPFGDDAASCTFASDSCTSVTTSGHAHVYILPDYPACLSDVISCAGKYIQSIKPAEGTANQVTVVIPGDRFPEAGTFPLSVGLQYNDHDSYPNEPHAIYDQFHIEIVER